MRATPPLLLWPGRSRRVVPVAATALGPGEVGEGVDGGAGVGMRVEADAALGADATPLAGEQRAAEQIRPYRHPVESPFVGGREMLPSIAAES